MTQQKAMTRNAEGRTRVQQLKKQVADLESQLERKQSDYLATVKELTEERQLTAALRNDLKLATEEDRKELGKLREVNASLNKRIKELESSGDRQ